MKKLTYRIARRIILVLMVLGLAALIAASYATQPGTLLRGILVWSGVVLYVIALALTWFAFRCPACGCRYYKGGLFLAKCPVCGAPLGQSLDKPLGFRDRTLRQPGWDNDEK